MLEPQYIISYEFCHKVRKMKSRENTTENVQIPGAKATTSVSRRSVLSTAVAAVGLSAITGTASAAGHEGSDETDESPETHHLTVQVTDMEGEREISEAMVKHDKKRDRTNPAGKVVFEVENGVHEMRAEKSGYEEWSRSVEINGEDKEIYAPLHADTLLA
ncbi:hypothetical protein [Halalkalicoccus salilacus]|uniref:hypothetical protein n=1 Tax=Halalkalicoccus TaxID=332246 RepID=UPI002F9695B6